MIYNSDEETTAKEAAIFDLLAGYHQLTEKLNDLFLWSFVRQVEDCRPEAVKQACDRIASGRAPGVNNNFPPTPADVASNARLFEEIAARADDRVPLYNGLLEADFGHGRVDMRGLTTDEQDRIAKLHGILPNGQNVAYLSLAEKKELLTVDSLKKLTAEAEAKRIGRDGA